MPCVISPYHYRLDWLMWFAALSAQANQPVGRDSWLVHLLWKLLENDETVLDLLGSNPFPESPPEKIRVQLYRYHFGADGNWWERELIRTWLGPFDQQSPNLVKYVERWK